MQSWLLDQVYNIRLWDEAMRAWEEPFILSCGQENPENKLLSTLEHKRHMIHLLLGVISQIGEYSGIGPQTSTIQALTYKPMYVCLLEIIIENDFPYMLHKLPVTMCHNGAFQGWQACT